MSIKSGNIIVDENTILAIDVSGTIPQRIVEDVIEMVKNKCSSDDILIFFTSSTVNHITNIKNIEDLPSIKAGAGTSFVPLFKKIDELGLHPSSVLYLTDGYGEFMIGPPDYPVYWLITSGGYESVPWGNVCRLEK